MSNKKKATLLPTLRFPGFEEPWEEMPLGKLGEFFRGLTYGADDVADEGLLVLRSSNIQDGQLILNSDLVFVKKPCPKELILKRGDIAICMSNGSKALVGKSGELDRDYFGEITVGAFCSMFRPALPFSKIAFKTPRYEVFVATGIAGGNIKNLKNSDLESFDFQIPNSPIEQQKIADCLSSLDELIAAQARKVDALKIHKKGLMQQLFPREGQIRPRLRFAEFHGEWQGTKLISLSSESLSNGVFNDPKKVGSGYKLINVSDMYIDTTIDEKRLLKIELSTYDFKSNQVIYGDIFFTRSSLVKSGIAVSNIYLGTANDVTFDGHLIKFRPDDDKVIPLFAHYLFKTEPIRAQLIARGKSATMTTIGQTDVASVDLFYPEKNEQRRIADCLTSLGDLITAAAQQLKSLKTYKKGLMQQLFPSVEAVEA